jgi:small nuclear ribonucleoprotein F
MEYKGVLVAVDSYMNIRLSETEEFIDGVSTGILGDVLIRCNNILYVRQVEGERAEDEEMVQA